MKRILLYLQVFSSLSAWCCSLGWVLLRWQCRPSLWFCPPFYSNGNESLLSGALSSLLSSSFLSLDLPLLFVCVQLHKAQRWAVGGQTGSHQAAEEPVRHQRPHRHGHRAPSVPQTQSAGPHRQLQPCLHQLSALWQAFAEQPGAQRAWQTLAAGGGASVWGGALLNIRHTCGPARARTPRLCRGTALIAGWATLSVIGNPLSNGFSCSAVGAWRQHGWWTLAQPFLFRWGSWSHARQLRLAYFKWLVSGVFCPNSWSSEKFLCMSLKADECSFACITLI